MFAEVEHASRLHAEKKEANLLSKLEVLVRFLFDFPDVEVFFIYFDPVIFGKRFTSVHMRSTDEANMCSIINMASVRVYTIDRPVNI